MLGKAVPPDLETAHRLAEGFALCPVLDSHLQCAVHRTDGVKRRGEALTLEIVHHVVEALVLLAEDVALGYAALVEEQFRGVGSQVPDLLQLLADAKTLGLGREEHERNALLAFAASTYREYD